MKRLMMIILVGFILFLSGCMSKESEPPGGDEPSIYDNIYIDINSMTFKNTPQSDLLYMKEDTYLNFKYSYEEVMGVNLTTEEEIAYLRILAIVDQIIDETSFDFERIRDFSSTQFNDVCNDLSIEIALEDIVAFNSLKTTVEELIDVKTSNLVGIRKLEYIELKLNITLSNAEEVSLDLLQQHYYEVYMYTGIYFDFTSGTIDDLLLVFNETNEYIPTESELESLTAAFNIVVLLSN